MKFNETNQLPVMLLDDKPVGGSQVVDIIRRQGLTNMLVRKIILDSALGELKISSEEESKLLEEFRTEKQLESDESYIDFLNNHQIDDKILRYDITVPKRISLYREERWGPHANTLYLKHKDKFDSVVYQRLQCNSPNTMREVYFRLKDHEESWESLAQQFNPNQSEPSARLGPVPVAEVEPEVLQALRKAGPGKICSPIPLLKETVIVQLECFESIAFNNDLRNRILHMEFENWLDEESSKMLKSVSFPR